MKRCLIALLLLGIGATVHAQSISGKVTDSEGRPLLGAHVRITGTYIAASTDEDGAFIIRRTPQGNQVLTVSFIGFSPISKSVTIKEEDQTINFKMETLTVMGPELTVRAIRAAPQTPTTFTNISKEEIEKKNLGQDMPYIMEFEPSVVVTSDAGAGVGYSGMRVRGIDPTRVNITINGIPLNDAESQGVFWVDLPDFASSTDNIQIQRGVGTSTNGAGAFGASINLQSLGLKKDPYLEIGNTIGSFNTIKNNVTFGTGLVGKGWTLDGRLSRIISDGYIDRASADLKSGFISLGHQTEKSSTKLNVFSGHEVTYQAWYGTPSAKLVNDDAATEEYIINNGLSPDQAENLRNSDRRYNHYLYDREVDDYVQTHYQLINEYKWHRNFSLQTALHYTNGAGYFEQFQDKNAWADDTFLSFYGVNDVVVGSDTISQSDIIRRRWLDNDFFGFTFSGHLKASPKLNLVLGGAGNKYLGNHYGEVIWAEYASNSSIRHKYYDNDADKTDMNLYMKMHYQWHPRLTGFSDLQFRWVNYSFLGLDNTGAPINQEVSHLFFNPKVGLNYEVTSQSRFYASVAVGTKEPNRNDYVSSSPNSRPLPEFLTDYEIGYRVNRTKSMFAVTGYFMDYLNQLVLTGELNDVGANTRVNVDKSHRAGLEFQWGIKLTDAVEWQANATFSSNVIKEYTGFADNWDSGIQDSTIFYNAPLAFSPSVIAGSNLIIHLLNRDTTGNRKAANLDLTLLTKVVGRQYIDNTGSEDRSIDPYFLNDVRLAFAFRTSFIKSVELNLLVRNLFNVEYASNAWVYRFTSGGGEKKLDGYFPQAGTHFLLGLTLKF